MSDFTLKEDAYPVYGEKPVGHLELIKGFYVSSRKKPNAWNRFWMRILLGWKWHDGNVIKE